MCVCLFTVVQDPGWIMVAPLQSPEVDSSAGLAVTVQPDGLHLKTKQERKFFRETLEAVFIF